METCGTCKHWLRVTEESDYYEFTEGDIRYGTCDAIPRGETEWNEAADRSLIKGDWKAVAQDASGYFAIIRTQESFGCVLHEPLPPE